MRLLPFLIWLAAQALAQFPLSLTVEETAGRPRRNVVVSQGIPVDPIDPELVKGLALQTANGDLVPAILEADGQSPDARVRWLRVEALLNLGPNERKPLRIVRAPNAVAPLRITREQGGIQIANSTVAARFSGKANIELSLNGEPVLNGPLSVQLYPDARSLINAGGKTTVLSPFEPAGFEVLQPSPHRATVVLRGRSPKQKAYNSRPGNNEAILGFDFELRFHFSALSPTLSFDWRIVNQTGYKAWLERFALGLPLAESESIVAQEGSAGRSGRWLQLPRFGITAPFVLDLGEGAGLEHKSNYLYLGGLNMPQDGVIGGAIPQVHRLFHNGMARTFSGNLCAGECAAQNLDLPHFLLPAAHYSRLGLLPEAGDLPQSGEFAAAIARSAQWLLDNQWRGTLWWGEWWREWDSTRSQGAEEASNAQSLLAPLYHYFRTGDRRFLDAAERSAWFVYDVQHTRRRNGFGPMLHTRRHLLDELDWIHPRYQRIAGPLLASHVFLASRERDDLIQTLKSFTDKIQGPDGTPYNWDERANQREASETGVDTSNMIEALIAAWLETGDSTFLDRARGYARWTVRKWQTRTDDKFWNWNLTRYVQSGMLAICRAAAKYPGRIPEAELFRRTAIEIGVHTIKHPELAKVEGTIAGGELHYVFYHAWLGSELSRLANDNTLLKPLLAKVREQMARQAQDGSFPMSMGSLWSQYPNTVVSYYDPKSVVAYVPVLAARLAALAGH